MPLNRRNSIVYGSLVAIWLLVIGWQIAEHRRVKEVAQAGLAKRARDIADTISALIRGMQFRGAVMSDRLEVLLNELVNERTNRLVRSSEVLWIALLNAANEPLASAGRPTVELGRNVVLPETGLWRQDTVTMEFAVAGVPVSQEGSNQPPVVAPRFRDLTNNLLPEGNWSGRGPRRESRDGEEGPPPPPPPDKTEPRRDERPDGQRDRPRRPFWARGMQESEYLAMIQRRELHGLVLAISTRGYEAIVRHDIWMRTIIIFFSGISALGVAVAWRNLSKTSDLQLRLVRASEMNTHLKEMNLAAAGLAHETRNPLNIIRGLAQMISRQPDAAPEIRERSRAIVDETDKVTVQLNEFINYSRPREIRRVPVALPAAAQEVVRALNFDMEEKKVKLEVKGDAVTIDADQQLFRQMLFNLLLNAVQALEPGGEIQVVTGRKGPEAFLEVRDNGPGVPPDKRKEIFKPYFTTHQKGTGLGLAVVQQIVLAHGWEIECLGNEPRGAVFRITHLKVTA